MASDYELTICLCEKAASTVSQYKSKLKSAGDFTDACPSR